eukprot:jgi/Astpho2/1885/Aster-x0085
MGHQAAQCTNSSINWKGLYGENAFKVKGVLFPSEVYAMEAAKKVDQKDLLERATAYAKEKCAAAGLDYEAVCAGQTVFQEIVNPNPKQPVKKEIKPDPGAGALPENWSEAKDAQGRVYFWHTKTKKVQWDRPTADTPVK